MCGIVSYFGPGDGARRVLNALALLAYRAPDSTGVALLDADGRVAVRRSVGTADDLQAVLAANPLPPARPGPVQVVLGHGRWAMVGAVTEGNAHPISDRSGTRLICENGSHNATLMLGMLAAQEAWWRRRGLPAAEPVHRTENTSEVVVCEWERCRLMLADGEPPDDSGPFLAGLAANGVEDVEEQALRLALWRLRRGNAHACAFLGLAQPETLYVSSHQKPIAVAVRTRPDGQQEAMVASDVNAALMLWPRAEVEAASRQTRSEADQSAQFAVDVIFLDHEVAQGRELFVRLGAATEDGRLRPCIDVSRYDGAPVDVSWRSIRLNPAMVGRGDFPTFTESHIAEIPGVLEGLVTACVPQGRLRLGGAWRDGVPVAPGINLDALRGQFGSGLGQLRRIMLIGEGSSWRDAQATAPLWRAVLPQQQVHVYRPVAMLNLGASIEAAHDLAVEISWSGTTDSLLKVDAWLAEKGVLRLAVTGRPQSDLGRRAGASGGTADVQTGVEVSVATVKGYQAILMMLNLCALQLAMLAGRSGDDPRPAELLASLTGQIPRLLRSLIGDPERRRRIRAVGERCRRFNKVAVVGSSPVDVEAELKIEELAQVVAASFDFHTASLRAVMERAALVPDEAARTLFVFNVTTPAAVAEARPLIDYLRELEVFCLVHTYRHVHTAAWAGLPHVALFESPRVDALLQPLIDAPFFFELAVALAYGRGLTPSQIDRPRNLAKSVTTTGAERRVDLEARQDFHRVDLAAFVVSAQADAAWDAARAAPSVAALRSTVALRGALAVLSDPLPPRLVLDGLRHMVVMADDEATENAAKMGAMAWQQLLMVDLTVYRRFLVSEPPSSPRTARMRLVRAGAVLALRDDQTVALPTDLSPLQLELLGAVYLMGLAVRLARQRGADTVAWEKGLARLALVLDAMIEQSAAADAMAAALQPYVHRGYDKLQILGGGQDYAAAASIARSIRARGFLAEPLYTDSAWHGPLATVGGPDAAHDTLIVILATDPLFQATALVDTQVYRTRQAPVLLVVPAGNERLPAVLGVDAAAVLAVPPVPRPFLPVVGAVFGEMLAGQLARLWSQRDR